MEKNIQPWMSWSDSSVRSSRNHSSPAMSPSTTVCTQLSVDSILGRASWKFRWLNTCHRIKQCDINKLLTDVINFKRSEMIYWQEISIQWFKSYEHCLIVFKAYIIILFWKDYTIFVFFNKYAPKLRFVFK